MKKSKPQKTVIKNDSAKIDVQKEGFLIVGIGASAGGVQALKSFFQNVPTDSNAAYVVILHLSPDHDSQLTEILQAVAAIPVKRVKQKVKVKPNHVYVVSPNESLSMADGNIVVAPILTVEERRAPVDIFFRTLAESHCSRAVTVVLSGTGANGSMGIKRVKENGGAAYVQNPREAEFSEMPRNSIATELIDEILNVAEIPERIVAYGKNLGKVIIPVDPEKREEDQQSALREIFTQLRVRTGHDFSNYKRPTILRRIERRINVRSLQSLSAYAVYLKENANETQALLKDLLISVTNFFRDKEAFQYLEQQVVPRILQDKKAGDQIRLWIAGCATGEEAYSLAMLLAEQIDKSIDAPSVQIFATDIDEAAIAAAREGFYTLNDAADVSPERLRRFFMAEKDGFRIRRELREKILFANHNLLKDPPFSRLDLATCRNLLIYFNQTAQERVLETLHFALKPGGYLFLGTSEAIDGASDLYTLVSRELRIFQSRQTQPRFSYPVPDLSPSFSFEQPPPTVASEEVQLRRFERVSYGDLHGEILEKYAPPSLIVNERLDIVHVSPQAGRYLQISGEPSSNLFKLIHPDLQLELSTAVYQAVERQTNVIAENLKIRIDGERAEFVNVSVRPVLRQKGETMQGFILILFEQSSDVPEAGEAVFDSSPEPINRHLEEALLRSQTQFRLSIEQSDIQAEELKASNEELQAINEELRSATEELETGKEELQSVNEELITVNQELKIKIEELSNSNNDLQNLINSTDIGTIFLDRSFRVQMFTPAVSELFNLLPADIGRPLSDITHNLKYHDLSRDVEIVLSKLQPVEREIEASNGSVYMVRISPYRTAEDYISGAIISFINITEIKWQKNELLELNHRIERQSDIFNTTLSFITDFAYVFDKNGRFIYSNQPLLDLLGITAEEIVGKNFFDLNYPKDLAAHLQQQIQQVFETKEKVTGETPFTSADGADGFYEYIFNPVISADGSVKSVAGSTRDVTTRKINEANAAFLAEISRSLSSLSSINEVMKAVGAKIGEYLQLSACAFVEINEMTNEATINHAWKRKNVPNLIGTYRLSEYLSGEFQKAGRAGEIFAVSDTQTDSRTDTVGYAALKIGSFLSVPLISKDEWQFLLIVYHSAPHEWQPDEIELVKDLTTRVWMRLERARADEELRESEERLQQLIKNLPGGVAFIVDRNLRYLLAEGEALVPSGFAPGDFIGKTVFQVLPPKMAKSHAAMYRKALKGEPFTHEHDAHGGTFLTRGAPLRTADGKIYAVLAVSYDISNRKRAEERLLESERRLRLIINSVEDYGIITTDVKGIINGWNPGAEKAFGYTEQEIIGKSGDIIFTTEDRKKNVPAKEMKKALSNGRAEDERWHLRRDGSRFYVSGVMQPLKDKKADGFVKIVRDMTERLKIEQIKHDKEMLQKLVKAQEDERKRIARDMHDELGQLLTGLRLKLESVRKLCEDNEELCSKVDETQTIAKHLDAGIDFLAWELRPAALDDLGLRAALAKYVREWSHFAGVTAELLGFGSKKERLLPEIETNLYRIAQESLNNVHKHAKAKSVEVFLEKRGSDLIVLIIADDGKGFNPTSKMSRQKGIGLIGMQERATLIGGSFEIESAPGKGTTIFVRVPVIPANKEVSNDE